MKQQPEIPVPDTISQKHRVKPDHIVHGGDIESAHRQYGTPIDKWIDLSTGISPLPYPDTKIATDVLTRLPYQRDSFRSAVRAYYGDYDFLATNGSQQGIAALPHCLKTLPIVLPDVGYQSHAAAWMQQGAESIHYPSQHVDAATRVIEKLIASGRAFHLLVINPNNPTCCRFSPTTLQRWSRRLVDGAILIVDEAFADLYPGQSVLAEGFAANMLVFRSFGKFFGLPGLRLGFVFAASSLLAAMRASIGVWDVNGAAQEIAIRAFRDRDWQTKTRQRLHHLAVENQKMWQCLFDSLRRQGYPVSEAHQLLFSSYTLDENPAKRLFDVLAQNAVLVRIIYLEPGRAIIRIGRIDTQRGQQVARINRIIRQSIDTMQLS
ncbi:MAG: hypothetical protein CSA50_05665 [Gammaproteobacteria bacterium]|nr:MAG: hypothetical protein CSA50_05665 [Gammaproteobacteria bacterium]